MSRLLQRALFWCEGRYSGSDNKETGMHRWIAPMKVFGYVVVLLMGVAIVYAAVITITHWSGISV